MSKNPVINHTIYSLPERVRRDIEAIEANSKEITSIYVYNYTYNLEVSVSGVDLNGWAFCKLLTYSKEDIKW